jgi:hypothetical protein
LKERYELTDRVPSFSKRELHIGIGSLWRSRWTLAPWRMSRGSAGFGPNPAFLAAGLNAIGGDKQSKKVKPAVK